MNIKSYSELIKLKTFEERFNYLALNGKVGEETFGFDRYLNQAFYKSLDWLRVRDSVIVRDGGCDLGIDDREIHSRIMVHHMNPIFAHDIEMNSDILLNPEYLICTSDLTHKSIHYGNENLLPKDPITRKPNDTIPWK